MDNHNKKGILSSIGRLFANLFRFGKNPQERTTADILTEEAIMSPSRTILKKFLGNRLGVIGLIGFIAVFTIVFAGSAMTDFDPYYEEGVLKNIGPGYGYMNTPKPLIDEGVKSISSGITFSVGVSNAGNLYLWGKDYDGATVIPEEIKTKLDGVTIDQAVAGDRHVVVLTEDGDFYGWGNNAFNQTEITQDAKMKIKNDRIVKLGAGDQYTAALTDKGNIVVWGSTLANNLNRIPKELDGKVRDFEIQTTNMVVVTTANEIKVLGVRGSELEMNVPEELKAGKVVVADMAMTSRTAAVLDDKGAIHTWGSTINNTLVVPEIEGKITSIVGGRNHFVAINDQGKVKAWGTNNYGESNAPNLENVSRVYSDYYQNYAVLNDGKVTTWGNNGFRIGTDEVGRDLFTRLLHGGRVTLIVAAVAVSIQIVIGVTVGLVAGYFGGRVDNLLMRFAEIVAAFPFYPLVITISAMLPVSATQTQRLTMIMIILGVLGWTGIARLVRGQILSEREKDYILAARALGIDERGIMLKHMLPSVISLIIVELTIGYASNLLTEAGLSFLGFGVKPPYPSWGNMLSGAQTTTVIEQYWWRWIFPAISVFLAALTVNLIGDALRDAVDPKSSER